MKRTLHMETTMINPAKTAVEIITEMRFKALPAPDRERGLAG